MQEKGYSIAQSIFPPYGLNYIVIEHEKDDNRSITEKWKDEKTKFIAGFNAPELAEEYIKLIQERDKFNKIILEIIDYPKEAKGSWEILVKKIMDLRKIVNNKEDNKEKEEVKKDDVQIKLESEINKNKKIEMENNKLKERINRLEDLIRNAYREAFPESKHGTDNL